MNKKLYKRTDNPTPREVTYGKRLLRLAKLLEELPEERFNYNHWVGHDFKGKQDISCGTTACALGWGCTMPEAQKAGFRLKKFYGIVGKDQRGPAYLASGPADLAKQVFGVSIEFLYRSKTSTCKSSDFYALFAPGSSQHRPGMKYCGSDATATQVAKNIRAYVFDRYRME